MLSKSADRSVLAEGVAQRNLTGIEGVSGREKALREIAVRKRQSACAGIAAQPRTYKECNQTMDQSLTRRRTALETYTEWSIMARKDCLKHGLISSSNDESLISRPL